MSIRLATVIAATSLGWESGEDAQHIFVEDPRPSRQSAPARPSHSSRLSGHTEGGGRVGRGWSRKGPEPLQPCQPENHLSLKKDGRTAQGGL